METLDERIASSALLLLLRSPSPNSLSSSFGSASSTDLDLQLRELNELVSSSGPWDQLEDSSFGSSYTSSHLSHAPSQIYADPLHMLALAASLNGINAKVRKKARSKKIQHKRSIFYYEIKNKETDEEGKKKKKQLMIGDDDEEEEEEEETAVSTVLSSSAPSSSSSSSSSNRVTKGIRWVRSAGVVTKRRKNSRNYYNIDTNWVPMRSRNVSYKKKPSKSVRRRADAILVFLSTGGLASEVRIRAALGDSPDTSKALRMLLNRKEVKRSGAGGRADPFLYSVAAGLHGDISST